MAITGVTRQNTQPCLGQLVKKLINNRCCLMLLRFFVAHPNGRFSKLAVVHALDETERRRAIEGAMEDLVSVGVLKTGMENSVSCYRLTHDEPVRGIVLRTAELDWHQWQLVFE